MNIIKKINIIMGGFVIGLLTSIMEGWSWVIFPGHGVPSFIRQASFEFEGFLISIATNALILTLNSS